MMEAELVMKRSSSCVLREMNNQTERFVPEELFKSHLPLKH